MTRLLHTGIFLGLILVTQCGPAVAADAKFDVSGIWDCQTDVANQKGSPRFTFKQEGNKLSGNYSGQYGEAKLSGTVDGDKIRFSFATQNSLASYEGTLTDKDQMKGEADYGEGNKGTWTGQRNSGKPSDSELAAESRLKELARVIGTGEMEEFKKYMTANFAAGMQAAPMQSHENFFRGIYGRTKGLDFHSLQDSRPNQVTALFKNKSNGEWTAIRATVDPAAPWLVIGMGTVAPKPPADAPATK